MLHRNVSFPPIRVTRRYSERAESIMRGDVMRNGSNFVLPSILAAAAGALLSLGYDGVALFFGLGSLIGAIAAGSSEIARQIATKVD